MPQELSQKSVVLRRRLIVAGAVLLIVAAAVAVTARDPGITWDEAIYVRYAVGYLDWFSSPDFSFEGLYPVWGLGQAHPPLGKLWIALCLGFFGRMADGITAVRLGAGLLFGCAAATLYLWQAAMRNERAGLLSAALFALMPRLFAHGHFANLEMPMLLLWLLTTIAFERGIRNKRWSIACGALFGLALLTKINALFLPLVLVPWGLLFHGRKALRNILAMALLGPALFFAGWPILWHQPIEVVRAYLADKLDRAAIPVYYLGRTYGETAAPWHYPFVLLVATTPLPILAAAAGGVVGALRNIRTRWRERAHVILLIWSAAFQVLLLAAPGVPKYDGMRLMLPAVPFVAVLAAQGLDAAWLYLRGRVANPRRAAWIAGALLALWLLLPVIWFHPLQLCYYSEPVGGPWGAKALGFETTYWNDTLTPEVVETVNREAPPNALVARVAVGSYVWPLYRATGAVREDLRDGDFDGGTWDVLIVVPRQGYWNNQQREFVARFEPNRTWTLTSLDALPTCMVYFRDRLQPHGSVTP